LASSTRERRGESLKRERNRGREQLGKEEKKKDPIEKRSGRSRTDPRTSVEQGGRVSTICAGQTKKLFIDLFSIGRKNYK